MDTNKGVNAGLLAMRAANARRAEVRKAGGLQATADKPTGGAPRKPKALATAAKLPQRVWRVEFVVEGDGEQAGKQVLWTAPDVSAPTIKRAIKGARQQARTLYPDRPIHAVAGVQDRDFAALPRA